MDNKFEVILKKYGLSTNVIEFDQATRTAQAAADALGCELACIVKSIMFTNIAKNISVLVLASGVNRVNEDLIAGHVGEAIIKADASFVKNITGFVIGGVAPIGHQKNIDYIFVDKTLLYYEKVWAAAGTQYSVFSCSIKDLININNGKVISIV